MYLEATLFGEQPFIPSNNTSSLVRSFNVFDEFARALDRFPTTMIMTIWLPVDEKGYLDRRCPHQECGVFFKVMDDDWKNHVPDETAYCPKCGTKAEPEGFNTPAQNAYIEQRAREYVSKKLNQAFTRATRRTRPLSISSGFFDITMNLSFQPTPPTFSLPPDTHEVLRQDLQCEECGCRWSVVGTGYFCPACKHNSVLRDFGSAVTTAIKVVDSIRDLEEAVAKSSDADTAADVVQQVVENQVENLFAAFQRLSEALFRKLPNAKSFHFDLNLFQRLDDASSLWHQATGQGYDTYLSKAEFDELRAMMQRRHKLTHNQGMVDQRYLDHSGDHSYAVGQRLVITETQVRSLATIIEILTEGLRQTVETAID